MAQQLFSAQTFNTVSHLNILNCSLGFLFLWKSRCYHRRDCVYAPTAEPTKLPTSATMAPTFSHMTNLTKAAPSHCNNHPR